ncbi:helix-turn-helix transcriptional regulator [Aureimonas ureilytica]|uniref:helix-turn-helix transcriptional regulator n=1 Tax=Aureimonas ureilytica TaxID=401562 RepID=UPI0012DE7BDE|nr:helix-turn-helix transcriptional regulator [Aureimonas ureilytica]
MGDDAFGSRVQRMLKQIGRIVRFEADFMDLQTQERRPTPVIRRRPQYNLTFTSLGIDEETARKLQAFGERYQLTMAELRLVIVLREGKGLKAAARRIGVGYETVRTQVKSVFQKTGTKRQAEVITLLVAFQDDDASLR